LIALVSTLVSEGSSDRALLPVLRWVLTQHSGRAFQVQWADLRRLPRPPRILIEKVSTAMELYPCDLLFVHRDADVKTHAHRVQEIRDELG
jgi:hypothetical protein